MSTMRERSKQEWTGNPNRDDINAGSLQRIADATEKMAQRYDDLLSSREYYKARCADLERRNNSLLRRLAALRGVITRLKRTRP